MDEAIRIFNANITRVPTDTDKQITQLRSILETRLNGMDRAIDLLQKTADQFPSRVDEKIDALQRVHEEKFASIETQFVERDKRSEQTSRDSKVAVDAALQAQKEQYAEHNRSSALAISKSETATTKQIDQQGILITANTKATDEKIDDVKQRITQIESGQAGKRELTSSSQSILHLVIAGFALLISLATTIFSVWHFASVSK